jgi:inorganic pyrophosphatase
VSPKLSDAKEKRDKVIRIRKYNYDRLAKLGDVSQDWDDVLTVVLDHYYKTKGKDSK